MKTAVRTRLGAHKNPPNTAGFCVFNYELTLRSKRNWVEFAKRGVSGLNGLQIQFCFEREMVKSGCGLEQFEFDITTYKSTIDIKINN